MKLDTEHGWPIIDRKRRHIRTPAGSFIPFYVIHRAGSIAALLFGIEVTFGITNWVTIPAAIATLAWAGETVDRATSHIRVNEYFRRLEAETDTTTDPDAVACRRIRAVLPETVARHLPGATLDAWVDPDDQAVIDSAWLHQRGMIAIGWSDEHAFGDPEGLTVREVTKR